MSRLTATVGAEAQALQGGLDFGEKMGLGVDLADQAFELARVAGERDKVVVGVTGEFGLGKVLLRLTLEPGAEPEKSLQVPVPLGRNGRAGIGGAGERSGTGFHGERGDRDEGGATTRRGGSTRPGVRSPE